MEAWKRNIIIITVVAIIATILVIVFVNLPTNNPGTSPAKTESFDHGSYVLDKEHSRITVNLDCKAGEKWDALYSRKNFSLINETEEKGATAAYKQYEFSVIKDGDSQLTFVTTTKNKSLLNVKFDLYKDNNSLEVKEIKSFEDSY